MQNSEYSPELHVPTPRSKGEFGVWIIDFLRAAAESIPEGRRPDFLRHAFRWLLQREGNERLSEDELRLRKEQFYALLPESLRVYFPWEPPESLPPPPLPTLRYPDAHVAFRQYGLIAAEWARTLSEASEREQRLLGARLLKYLYQQVRQQGIPVEEATLIENLHRLSGGTLHISPQGLSDSSVPELSERPHRKGHKPFRRRR